MAFTKFSVVLIAVMAVLCAQLVAATPRPTGRHKGSGNSDRNHKSHSQSSHGSSHGITNHKSHPTGSHGNTHPNRGSSHDADRSHYTKLESRFGSRYDTPDARTSDRQHDGAHKNHHGSSSSSVQGQGRGKGGLWLGGNSSGSTGRRPGNTRRQERRQKIRNKAKEVEKKKNKSKKGILNALSKQLSKRTGINIDLGSIWGKLKNNATKCAKDSQDAILDFVTTTVSKSVFGGCTEAERYAQLQKELDSAEETLRTLKSNEKTQLRSCRTETGAMAILFKKDDPSRKTVIEALKLNVTDSAGLLDAGANITTTEQNEDDSSDDEDENREMSTLETLCRQTVENKNSELEDKLDAKMTRLTEEMELVDPNKVENCWSQNFGEKLGTAGIKTLVDTISCTALARVMG